MVHRPLLPCLLALVASLAACNDYALRGTEHTEVWVLEPSVAVDILFVVDNSPSMVQEHDKVKAGFASFIQEVNASESDWRIGVITTDLETELGGVLLGPEPAWLSPETPNYQALFMAKIASVGTGGSGWEKGLQAAKTALMGAPAGLGDTANAGFLRPDADLAIVVVSDENDCSDEGALPHIDQEECYSEQDLLVPLTDYIKAFRNLSLGDAQTTFSAIVGPPIVDGCEDTKPGFRYSAVADELDGLTGNICEADYTTIMADLGLTATGIQTWFPLQATPDLDSLEVTVDDVEIPEDVDEIEGWSYRADDNAVYFWGSSVPPRGATVRVHYWTHVDD